MRCNGDKSSVDGFATAAAHAYGGLENEIFLRWLRSGGAEWPPGYKPALNYPQTEGARPDYGRPTATAAADSAAHQVVEALFGLEVKVAPAL